MKNCFGYFVVNQVIRAWNKALLKFKEFTPGGVSCFSPPPLPLTSTIPCDMFTTQREQTLLMAFSSLRWCSFEVAGKKLVEFSFEFQAIQSKSLSYPGNVNVIGLESKNEQGEFFLTCCSMEPYGVFIYWKSPRVS